MRDSTEEAVRDLVHPSLISRAYPTCGRLGDSRGGAQGIGMLEAGLDR